MSICYVLYRSFGGAVDNSTIQLSGALDVYFGIHGAVAIVVMTLEVLVLAIGITQLQKKASNRWQGKLTKILFFFWWFAFLTGEIFYIVMYVL